MFREVGTSISNLDELEEVLRIRVPSPNSCENLHPFRCRRQEGHLCPC